jgi:hypothetical protein
MIVKFCKSSGTGILPVVACRVEISFSRNWTGWKPVPLRHDTFAEAFNAKIIFETCSPPPVCHRVGGE